MNAPAKTLNLFDPVLEVYAEVAFDIIFSKDEDVLLYVLPKEFYSIKSIKKLADFLNRNCIPFCIERGRRFLAIELSEIDELIYQYTYDTLVDYFFISPPCKINRVIDAVFMLACDTVLYPPNDAPIHIELPYEIQTVTDEATLAHLLNDYQIPFMLEESGTILTITSVDLDADVLKIIESIDDE